MFCFVFLCLFGEVVIFGVFFERCLFFFSMVPCWVPFAGMVGGFPNFSKCFFWCAFFCFETFSALFFVSKNVSESFRTNRYVDVFS